MAMAERNSNDSGISVYYRTLPGPGGEEEPCGMRLELAKASPEIVKATMVGQEKKHINVSLILNGDQPPLEYSDEDLGRSPKQRREMLNGVAEMANQWGDTLIIMERGQKENISNRPSNKT